MLVYDDVDIEASQTATWTIFQIVKGPKRIEHANEAKVSRILIAYRPSVRRDESAGRSGDFGEAYVR